MRPASDMARRDVSPLLGAALANTLNRQLTPHGWVW